MRRPLLLLGLVFLVLGGLYAAAGYWLLPRYVSERLIAEAARLGYELRIAAVRTDPFRLRVELRDAQLAVAENLTVSAPRVRAQLSLSSLLARDFVPQRIALSDGAVDAGDNRIRPLQLALQRQPGRYRVALQGPVAAQGELSLSPLRLEADVSATD